MVHRSIDKVALGGLLIASLTLGGCAVGVPELLIILGIVLLLFGAARLPALGRALGETVRSFKDSVTPDALDGDDAKKLDADKNDEKVAQIEDAKVEPVERKKS